MFRAGAMGSQAVLPGLWAGDQSGDWIGLGRAIRSAATGGMSGFASWGSDVGGYSAGDLTADVFMRWAQLGAISPVMEVGGAGPNATPWVLGDEAMRVLRDSAVLHYELFPLPLRPAAEARRRCCARSPSPTRTTPRRGAPTLELLVGPDLLAAPVAGPGTAPSVYLPQGSWVDLFTGKTVEGGRSFTRATPLDRVPALRARRCGDPVQPADADRLVVGRERADASGTRGLPRDERRDARAARPAGRRPDLRPGRRAAREGDDRRRRASPWTWNAGPLPGVVIRTHGPDVEGEVMA